MKNVSTQFKNKKVKTLNVTTMKTTIHIMAVCLLSVVMVISCSKYEDDLVIDETMSQKLGQANPEVHMMSTSSITYGVTPSVGTFTPNSSSSITLPGTSSCGSFMGGVIKARVKSPQSGSVFTVQFYKQDGTNFSSGTAYVKATSVCGSVAGQVTITGTATVIEVNITATFPQGVTHFYPVFISSVSGGRYYAEPFIVSTSPAYNTSTPYTTGQIIATVDGVNLQAAGPYLQGSALAYQCTKFCQNYYASVYSLSFSGWGDAHQWFNNLDTRFEKHSNNGSVAPRIGDILCMSGGGGLGHVAIINEVTSTQVKLAHQNSGTTWLPIGGVVNRSGNNLTVSGYTVQGWLRKKP